MALNLEAGLVPGGGVMWCGIMAVEFKVGRFAGAARLRARLALSLQMALNVHCERVRAAEARVARSVPRQRACSTASRRSSSVAAFRRFM